MTEIGELEGKKVVLTAHAIERLVERMAKLNKGQVPKEPEKIALKMFPQTEEEMLPPLGRLRRLLNHKGEDARYFIYEGWRFVLVERADHYDVVTIERDMFAFQKDHSPA